MNRYSRIARALAPLVLIAPLPLQAQPAPPASTAPVAIPLSAARYLQPNDPWIYRGTDIPVDREWLFGEMPNGLRYAVRHAEVPPGQVSIRIRVDAGSLHERDTERGFAHLIEHLTFRESKYLENGQAIPVWQRLGASFGSDTNAETSPTHTVYKLDLPNARPEALEESVKLLSGMVREPALSTGNLALDVPIVLAERRESAGPGARVSEASRELFYEGQRLADRSPIGDVETLQNATAKAVRAFHDRWYRPENTVIVAAGDADPQVLAALVEKYFADWKGEGKRTPEPDFGAPKAPPGADPANPVGRSAVVVEPSLPRGVTYAILRPWAQVDDNLEYNRGLLIDAVAEAIVNRRLENQARNGASYLFAGVEGNKISRSADATYVAVTPLTDDWESALKDVRGVIADALAKPPSQEEIDRQLAEFDVVFANNVEQQAIQAGARLADDIVNAVDIREAVAAPETILQVFREMRGRFTPNEVFAHTKRLFSGTVIRTLLLTPNEGEATAAQVTQAMQAPVAASTDVRQQNAALTFDQLPPIGEAAPPAQRTPLGVLGVEQLTFANGVKALVWKTDNEPGRATVRVRFGSGFRGFSDTEAPYIQLGQAALASQGFGPVGQNDLDQLASGRKLGFDFQVEDGAFTLTGRTRPEDVADQLYLFAAKLAMPRWDAAPVERAKAAALMSYGTFGASPNGILSRDLQWLLRDRDPRYQTPGPDDLQAVTAEGFREVWEPLLKQGPLEVTVFGDIDREATVAALSRTFGALSPRDPIPASALARGMMSPEPNRDPVVITHQGEADQAAAVMAWPTGGGSQNLPESRKLEVLSQVFANRLLDAMREQAGASYAPQVASNWPLDVDTGGSIMAVAQLPPAAVPAFFKQAEAIAADLAANGPTEDELARVTEPFKQLISRLATGHTYWMNQLDGATIDPNRVTMLPSLMRDYTQTTPQEMQALAAKYLGSHPGFHLAILPENAPQAAAKR
ncbi:M16 family metallopeptidase [Altericroceibacterium xinjiangense]|uniref:M16 family metallopeptidase n=1 Tax=Altericroceibacterium xinjiangense TaxID=762261 RepID=UPI000F7DEB14|nr:M16 family metallopeptidase [Altericroceibacterium xinjiangense]